MKNSIVVKNFKYKEIVQTISLLCYYNKLVQLRLFNYINAQLISFITLQDVSLACMSKASVSCNVIRWADLTTLHAEIKKKNLLLFHGALYGTCNLDIIHKLCSFLLFKFCLRLVDSSNSTVSLSTKKNIFTLLRSPHTDKKSREQFKKLEYRKLLVSSFFSPYLLRLVNKKECITSKIRSRYVRY